MLMRLLVAVLIGVIALVTARLVVEERFAVIIALLIGVLVFLGGINLA